MKHLRLTICKLFLTILLSLVSYGAKASVVLDATNFPDPIFRTYVAGLTGVSVGGTISDEALKKVTEIRIDNMEVTSLKGIEYFTELKILYCSGNKLTSLDVSKNTLLKTLLCRENNLTSLDVSKNPKLESLSCYTNNISSLDVSNNQELAVFYCYKNNLSSLDVTNNTNLVYFNCNYNNLTSLDVSKNTMLEEFSCFSNNLTSLDVSKNTKLKMLACGENKLTRLDVSKNTALTKLICPRNQIGSLALSGLAALERLSCDDNKITQLNLSNNTKLKTIECHGNGLTYLNLDNCPIETKRIYGQSSTRRFQIMSSNSIENDCWALYVGTSDASRIRNLKIDGESKSPEMLTKDPGWMVVSNDRKKIPLKVTYEIYTGNDVAGWMDVTVNYDVKNYGVYVDGKELTSLNFYDIPGLKSGTAYLMDEPEGIGWSGYLPTLVLSDAKIEGVEGIRNEQAYFLKIVVKGDNEVTATDFNAFANNTAGVETVFSGGGTVRFTATGDRWHGIYAVDSRVTLKEATTIMAKGDGMGYLDDNSTLVIQEGSALMGYGNKYASMELPLADQRKWDSDIQIRYPVGAYIGDRFHVYYAGTTTDVQKEWVVIGPEGAVPPEEKPNYDLNGDGKVSTADIQIIINEMKKTQASQNMKYDLNGDGKISTADIQVIINEMKK